MVKNSHVTGNIQSELFISAYDTYTKLGKRNYDTGSREICASQFEIFSTETCHFYDLSNVRIIIPTRLCSFLVLSFRIRIIFLKFFEMLQKGRRIGEGEGSLEKQF